MDAPCTSGHGVMRGPQATFPAGGRSVPGGVVVIRRLAGFASLGAGIIHLAAVSEHVAQWWLHGVFFLVLGVVQIAWAVQAMERDRLPVPHLFATLNAAVIGLWLVTRTSGLPVGPEPWQAEAVGTADLVCTGPEAVVVVEAGSVVVVVVDVDVEVEVVDGSSVVLVVEVDVVVDSSADGPPQAATAHKRVTARAIRMGSS